MPLDIFLETSYFLIKHDARIKFTRDGVLSSRSCVMVEADRVHTVGPSYAAHTPEDLEKTLKDSQLTSKD